MWAKWEVRWSPHAAEDLAAIVACIRRDDPASGEAHNGGQARCPLSLTLPEPAE
jgi:hypothetical protein